jgi:hypothetical protein
MGIVNLENLICRVVRISLIVLYKFREGLWFKVLTFEGSEFVNFIFLFGDK